MQVTNRNHYFFSFRYLAHPERLDEFFPESSYVSAHAALQKPKGTWYKGLSLSISHFEIRWTHSYGTIRFGWICRCTPKPNSIPYRPYWILRHYSNICPTTWRLWACVCARACAVEIKPVTLPLRVSLMYALRRAYCLLYKMATFITTKGLFNTVYSVHHTSKRLMEMWCRIKCDERGGEAEMTVRR